MKYKIYFDESNKIDSPNKMNSYYGAYGVNEQNMNEIIQNVQGIYEKLGTKSELHFSKYNHDKHIRKYFSVLDYIINKDIYFNLLIVNNSIAQSIAEQLQLTIMELRSLFYIKIPERLFYGITRDIAEKLDIEITIDHNDEYTTLGLHSKIQEQMNAHSVYRNKSYKIVSVNSESSDQSIPLQIIDTIMGIVVFLIERSYTEQSDAVKIKNDLIYRFLSHGENIERFQNQIKLFTWSGKENLSELSIGNYISKFMIYQSQFDISEINRLQSIRTRYPNMSVKEYRMKMEYSNSRLRTLIGYIDQLDGKGRNHSLLY